MWKNHRKLLIVDTEYFTFIIFVTFPLHIINILSELRHCVCTCVCRCIGLYIYMWRPEIDFGMSFFFFFVFLRKGVPTESESYYISWLDGQ